MGKSQNLPSLTFNLFSDIVNGGRNNMAVCSLKGEWYEAEKVSLSRSCLTGDDAIASAIEHTHTGGRWVISRLTVADTD